MKVLGNILHLANSGKLIVKTTKTPPAGAFVYTNDKNKIGRVGGIFGPVKNPYVSINLYRSVNKRDLENRCGEKIFVSTKKEDKDFKKSKSSKNSKYKSKSYKSSKSKNSKNKKNKKRNRSNKSNNKQNTNGNKIKSSKSSNKKNNRKNIKRRG